MATIVNDRDVMLQGAAVRVTSTSPFALVNNPLVTITPSTQVFSEDYAGTVTPNSVTFNSTVSNVLDPITYKWYMNGNSSDVLSTSTSLLLTKEDFLSTTYGPDDYFSNVLLLLNGTGANNSSTMTDASSFNRTPNQNTGVTIDTTIKKAGTGSMEFGTSKALYYNATETELGDVFTVEMWVYPTTVPTASGTWGIAQKWDYNLSGNTVTGLKFAFRGVGSSLVVYASGTNNSNIVGFDLPNTFTAGTWTHIAYVRNGTFAEIFVDGISKGSVNTIPLGVTSSQQTVLGLFQHVNGATYQDWLDGYIDNFRLTNGVARYNTTFDPSAIDFESGGSSSVPFTGKTKEYVLEVYSGGVLKTSNKCSVTKADDGINAPLLKLNPSGLGFIYDSITSTASSSPTITIDIILKNIVVSGIINVTATAYTAANAVLPGTITPGGSGLTRTITAAQFNSLGGTTTKYLVFEASVLDAISGNTLTDKVTLYRGDNGSDAITVLLSNEAHAVAASDTGVVSSYTGADTYVAVYKGGTDITSSCTLTTTVSNASGTLTGNGGVGTVALPNSTGVTGSATPRIIVTGMTADVASVTVTASIPGYPNTSRTFSLVKSKAGINGGAGSDGKTVTLATDRAGFVYSSAGTLTGTTTATLTATAYAHTGGTVYYDFLVNNVSQQNTTSNTYTYTAPAAYSSMPQTVVVKTRIGGTGTAVLATDAIAILGGQIGSKVVQVYLTNAAVTLQANNAGTVSSYVGSGTSVQVAEGATLLTQNATLASNQTFRVTSAVGTSITVGGVSGTGTTTYTYADASSMTANTAYITYMVETKNSEGTIQTFTVKQNFSKAIAGATGGTGGVGATGTRGTIATKIASYSTDTDLYNAITAITGVTGALPATPIKGDIVYTNTGAKECTVAGNPGTWGNVTSFINGNMVISGTLAADRIAAGTVSAEVNISSSGYISATGVIATGSTSSAVTGGSTTGLFENPTTASSTVTPIGVVGNSTSTGSTYGGIGILGMSSSSAGSGVYGFSSGNGVYGFGATGGKFQGTTRGVYASTLLNAGYAIESAGGLYISNSFSGTALLISSGNVTISSGNVAVTGAITATGNITAYFSDDNLKTRIGPIESAIDKLKTLDTFYYRPNQLAQDLGYKDELEVGVSAQQVQKILPMIVRPAPISDKYLTVWYERLAPLLIAGIKELNSRVETLENDNT